MVTVTIWHVRFSSSMHQRASYSCGIRKRKKVAKLQLKNWLWPMNQSIWVDEFFFYSFATTNSIYEIASICQAPFAHQPPRNQSKNHIYILNNSKILITTISQNTYGDWLGLRWIYAYFLIWWRQVCVLISLLFSHPFHLSFNFVFQILNLLGKNNQLLTIWTLSYGVSSFVHFFKTFDH